MSDTETSSERAQYHPPAQSEIATLAPNEAGKAKELTDTAGTRPSDADIITQENEIREAEATRIPFLGDVEPLAALAAEYEGGSEVFRTKIHSLERGYNSFRRSRGDGNCFFRSFLFAYLDDLITRGDYAERSRVVDRIQATRQKMLDSGYQELVFEDSQQHLLNQLNAIKGGEEGLTREVLLINMRDGEVSNMIVSFLRLATSAEIDSRAEFFAPFIMGMTIDELSVEAFRRRCVEPMGEEADHVHIVALSDMLQVPVRVLYLDRTMDAAGADASSVNEHDFVPEALTEAARGGDSAAAARMLPRVHLLYRPGHYDILSPNGPSQTPADSSGTTTTIGAVAGGGGLDESSVSRSIAAALAAVNSSSCGAFRSH